MKKSVFLTMSFFLLIAFLGAIFFVRILDNQATEEMRRAFAMYETWTVQERAFLKQLPLRENALSSGTYILETRVPEVPTITTKLEIIIDANGELTFPGRQTNARNGIEETFAESGGLVSWYLEGVLYSGDAEYIGVIDGDMIWGHVFGYNRDEGAVGVWRIYKQE